MAKCPTCGHTKITQEVKDDILKRYKQGEVQTLIASYYGITQASVSKILKEFTAPKAEDYHNLLEDEI